MKDVWRAGGAAAAFCALAASVMGLQAWDQTQTPGPQIYKGLSMTVTTMTRSKSVSLRDCPPGANTQRGVIRPIDDQEFVTVTLNVNVLPSFEPVPLARPTLVDAAGTSYNTAQTFTSLGSAPAHLCEFSFRVPTGAEAVRLLIGEASFDLTVVKK